jgi:3alpha(or 20beta)-hydroxysteroid dehydrogenase
MTTTDAGRLAGAVAIISGAARGQGEAEARRFVAEGAKVVLGDVLDAEGEAVAASLGDAAAYQHLDVTSAEDWAAAVVRAERFGPLTVLVNNAAVHWTKPIEFESVDALRRILDINLIGVFLGIQAVIGPMRAAGGGSIVNISSSAGLTGLAYHGAYGSTKWAVRGLTKTAAVELGPDGIRVNSVHPGPIKTAMLPPVRGGADADTRFAHLPLGRAGEVDEVADLVLFLASSMSSYMTGTEFVIDGGSNAGPPPTYRWSPES